MLDFAIKQTYSVLFLTVRNLFKQNKRFYRGWIFINDRRIRVRSVDDTRFVARIHWCLPYIPGSAIAAALGGNSVVTNVEYEMYKGKGLENISTGIGLVSMVGDRHTVPHLIQATNPLNKQTYEMLVTVVGRVPLCLKCRRTGHYRRDCTTPYCRHRGTYGHSTEQCTLEKVSYANAAKKNMAAGSSLTIVAFVCGPLMIQRSSRASTGAPRISQTALLLQLWVATLLSPMSSTRCTKLKV